MKQIIELSKLSYEETVKIFNEVYEKHSPDFHYLAFYDGIFGFSPLGSYLERKSVMKDKDKIMRRLMKGHVPVSLYPVENVTLYPFIPLGDHEIEIETNNIKRNFKIILNYQDIDDKCPYMFVEFYSKIKNVSKEALIEELKDLLNKSKTLKTIYVM